MQTTAPFEIWESHLASTLSHVLCFSGGCARSQCTASVTVRGCGGGAHAVLCADKQFNFFHGSTKASSAVQCTCHNLVLKRKGEKGCMQEFLGSCDARWFDFGRRWCERGGRGGPV